MESSSWPESLPSNRIKAIEELTQGQRLIDNLREMIGRPEMIESDLKSGDGVVGQILGMFDNTLSILSPCFFNEVPEIPTRDDVRSSNNSDEQKLEDNFDDDVKTVVSKKGKRGCYKRRKTTLTSTKITSTLIDDGYAWRKYGQKTILNAKHQRHYYRCTHKFDQGCQATKQVQKMEDEPPTYNTTYHGYHTCKNLRSGQAEMIFGSSNISFNDSSILYNFETKGVVPVDPSTRHERPNKEGFSPTSLRRRHNQSLSVEEAATPSHNELTSVKHGDEISSSTASTGGYEMNDYFALLDFCDPLYNIAHVNELVTLN